jgi:hypothetical protein
MLGLGRVAAKEVYAALDWLGREQRFIEARLARRHLKDGTLLLYDVVNTFGPTRSTVNYLIESVNFPWP